MRIFCELLPRLGCGNVAVVGGPEGGASVQVTEYGMEVGGANFSLPCDASMARLVPDSVSCLTVAASGTTTFRVKLGREGREELPCLLPTPRPQYRGVTTPRVPAPPLQPGQMCVLVCRCGEDVGRLEVGRVLPLPSLHYQAGSLDWFCCASKLTSPATATPRSQDLLYSAHSTAISLEHLSSSAVLKEGLVFCAQCDTELGEVKDGFLHLWSCAAAVQLISSETLQGFGSPPKKPKKEGFHRTSSVAECCTAIVNSLVGESLGKMPKFLLVNRQEEKLLVWVMEREQAVLTASEDSAVMREELVMKILYKTVTDVPDIAVDETLKISSEMFDSVTEMLEASVAGLPNSFKTANGFHVGYIPRCS